jgi:hypothetical protein
MNIDLYSERLRQQQTGGKDVYQYTDIPKPLRVQVAQIAVAAIGPSVSGHASVIRGTRAQSSMKFWNFLRDTLTREYGVHLLSQNKEPMSDVLSFLQHSASTTQCLDVIELIARVIDRQVRKETKYGLDNYGITQNPDDALAEINLRLRRAGCGFQVEDGEVVRVDSQYTHAEIVKPALSLLANPVLRGANEEFRSAHAHYRAGSYEAALVDAAKALESTLKAICTEKKWHFPANATAKPLLDTVMQNQLLPRGVLDHVSVVRATLEQGIPYIRNNFGGHGQGALTREIPAELCAYGLHLAASAMLLLANAAGLK